jgi:hypothetical protein
MTTDARVLPLLTVKIVVRGVALWNAVTHPPPENVFA